MMGLHDARMLSGKVIVHSVASMVRRAQGVCGKKKEQALRAVLELCRIDADQASLPMLDEVQLEDAVRSSSLLARQYLLAIGAWIANADHVETGAEQLVLSKLRRLLGIPPEDATQILRFVRTARSSALLDPTAAELHAILKATEYFTLGARSAFSEKAS